MICDVRFMNFYSAYKNIHPFSWESPPFPPQGGTIPFPNLKYIQKEEVNPFLRFQNDERLLSPLEGGRGVTTQK